MKTLLTFILTIILFSKIISQDSNDTKPSQQKMEHLLAQHESSPWTYETNYNLGTLYLEKGDLLDARWYLERASLLAPNDKDVAHNIELLRDKLSTDITQLPDFFLTRLWNYITSLFYPGVWFIFHVLFLLAFLSSIYFIVYNKAGQSLKNLKIMAYSLLALTIFALIAGQKRQKTIFNSNLGVVTIDAKVYENADQSSKQIELLSPGVLVKSLEPFGDWVKVELEDKQVGFLKGNNIKYLAE